MANDGNRIYIGATGVEIADIQTVIGSSRNDIGGLIVNGDINKWAKYKPVRHSKAGVLTDAERLSVIYGLSIPECYPSTLLSQYSTEWSYLKPRGLNGAGQGSHEWYRFLDFNGYQRQKWSIYGSNSMLSTIFNGQLTIPGLTIGAEDVIAFSMQCRENDDIDQYEGLLYPYDFDNAYPVKYNLSNYYIGLCIIDNINGSSQKVWVIAGPRVGDFYNTQGWHFYANLQAKVPSSVANASCVILPILGEYSTIPSGETDPAWTYEYQGRIFTLNGAYLPSTKHADNQNLKITFTDVVIGSTGITFNVSFKNETGDVVTVNNLIGYLLSYDSNINEHSSRSAYSGPDYKNPSTRAYIFDSWPQNYYQGDIYTHVRTGEAENPDELSARYINLLPLFQAANNNSRNIGDNVTVTFPVSVNNAVLHGFVGDDFGPYVDGAVMLVGLHAGQFNTMRDYTIVE